MPFHVLSPWKNIDLFFSICFNIVHFKSQAINTLNNIINEKWLIKIQYSNFSLTRKNSFYALPPVTKPSVSNAGYWILVEKGLKLSIYIKIEFDSLNSNISIVWGNKI